MDSYNTYLLQATAVCGWIFHHFTSSANIYRFTQVIQYSVYCLSLTAKRFWIFTWWKICRIFFSPYIWYRTVTLQQVFGNLYQWLLCIDIYCLSGHRNMYIFVSNHRQLNCLPNRLFRRRSKKTSKLRATGLCKGKSPVTGEVPSQRTRNTSSIYISIKEIIVFSSATFIKRSWF